MRQNDQDYLARAKINHFGPLLKINCSHFTSAFICLSHLPLSTHHDEFLSLLPSHSVCINVYFHCSHHFNHVGLPWNLNWNNFPRPPSLCIKSSPPKSTPISSISISTSASYSAALSTSLQLHFHLRPQAMTLTHQCHQLRSQLQLHQFQPHTQQLYQPLFSLHLCFHPRALMTHNFFVLVEFVPEFAFYSKYTFTWVSFPVSLPFFVIIVYGLVRIRGQGKQGDSETGGAAAADWQTTERTTWTVSPNP